MYDATKRAIVVMGMLMALLPAVSFAESLVPLFSDGFDTAGLLAENYKLAPVDGSFRMFLKRHETRIFWTL